MLEVLASTSFLEKVLLLVVGRTDTLLVILAEDFGLGPAEGG